VTAALGLAHEVTEVPRSRLSTELRKHELTSFATPSMTWAVPLADHLAGRFDVVYDGLGGDVLSAGLEDEPRLRLYEEGRLEELARLLLVRRHQEEALDAVLTREASRRLSLDVAVERLVPELERFAEAANPLGAFWFWNRNRRELSTRPYSVLAGVAEVRTPYVDEALVRHLCSLPASMTSIRLGGAFHEQAIRLGHPGAPDIPWTGTTHGRRAPAAYRRFAAEAAAYALRSPGTLVRRSAVVGRLLGRLVDGRQAYRRDLVALYLLHLDRVVART
jgi:hypothetical protein